MKPRHGHARVLPGLPLPSSSSFLPHHGRSPSGHRPSRPPLRRPPLPILPVAISSPSSPSRAAAGHRVHVSVDVVVLLCSLSSSCVASALGPSVPSCSLPPPCFVPPCVREPLFLLPVPVPVVKPIPDPSVYRNPMPRSPRTDKFFDAVYPDRRQVLRFVFCAGRLRVCPRSPMPEPGGTVNPIAPKAGMTRSSTTTPEYDYFHDVDYNDYFDYGRLLRLLRRRRLLPL